MLIENAGKELGVDLVKIGTKQVSKWEYYPSGVLKDSADCLVKKTGFYDRL